MKQIIKESDLRSVIREYIEENLKGFNFGDPNLYEKKKSPQKSDKDEKIDKIDDIHIRKVKRNVLGFFKKRTKQGTLINKSAPYAYALWPGKEKSDARSQFSKCLWGKLNDDGFPYSFTDAEITRLYSMITAAAPAINESLTEARFCSRYAFNDAF